MQKPHQYISGGIYFLQVAQQRCEGEVIDVVLQPAGIGRGIAEQVHRTDAALE